MVNFRRNKAMSVKDENLIIALFRHFSSFFVQTANTVLTSFYCGCSLGQRSANARNFRGIPFSIFHFPRKTRGMENETENRGIPRNFRGKWKMERKIIF